MPAPTYEGYVLSSQASGSSSWSLAGPSTVNVGDLLVVFLITDETQTTSTGSSTGSPTWPSGWTEIQAGVAKTASNDASGYAAYKIAVSADTSAPVNYTFGWSGSIQGSAVYVRISGVDGTTPINVSNVATTASGQTQVTIPAITTTVADTLLLAWAGVDESSSYTDYYSNPMVSGWTQRLGSAGTPSGEGGSNTFVGLATTTQASAASTGNIIITIATENDALIGFLVAVAPAAGGAGATTKMMNYRRRRT